MGLSLLSQLPEMSQNYLQKTLEAYHIPTSWEEPDSSEIQTLTLPTPIDLC